VIRSSEPYFDAAERFDDESSILTIIPAGFVKVLFVDRLQNSDYVHSKELIRTTRRYAANRKGSQSSPTVQLAHQTVKECLLSSRVASQRFTAEPVAARTLMREACLGYFIHIVQEFSLNDETSQVDLTLDYQFLGYVCTCWRYHFHGSVDHDRIMAQYLSIQLSRGGSTRTAAANSRAMILPRQEILGCSTGSPCTQCRRIMAKHLHASWLNSSANVQLLNPRLRSGK